MRTSEADRRRRLSQHVVDRWLLGTVLVLVLHGVADLVGTTDAYGAIGDVDGAVRHLFDQRTTSFVLCVVGLWAAAIGLPVNSALFVGPTSRLGSRK